MLGIKDRDTFPLIFYRENCADMAVTEDDVAEDFLAQSKALLITGTHFSTEHVHRVSTTALERARRNDVRTVLDIDYRPVLWGLTKRGDGETRFIASDAVTAHLQAILPLFDLVIGTDGGVRDRRRQHRHHRGADRGARGDAGDARRQARPDGLRGDRRRRFRARSTTRSTARASRSRC